MALTVPLPLAVVLARDLVGEDSLEERAERVDDDDGVGAVEVLLAVLVVLSVRSTPVAPVLLAVAETEDSSTG